MDGVFGRVKAWKRLLTDLPSPQLDDLSQCVGLSEIPRLADAILSGQVRGRTLVDVNR